MSMKMSKKLIKIVTINSKGNILKGQVSGLTKYIVHYIFSNAL